MVRSILRTVANSPAFLELGLLAVACLWVVGPAALGADPAALGRPTRDLYDHLALLDAWFLSTEVWNWPEGGRLVPPDVHGMLLGGPALALGLSRAWAYNFGLVVRLWLACVGGWALGRRVGSGLVGGVAFGLSPFLLGEVYTGEAETLSAWPLAVMAWLLERGGTRGWIAAGVVAAVGALGSWYYGVFLAVYLVAWTVLDGRRAGRSGWLPVLVFVVVIAAPAFAYGRVLASPDQLFRGPDMATYLSTQPRALAGMVSDPLAWLGHNRGGATHDDRLGLTIVVLAAFGLADRSWGRRWWFAAVAVVGLLLAIGPILHLGGRPITDLTPYRLLTALPLFGLMRLPHRWLLVASLGLAVLAARGGRRVPHVAALLIVLEAGWFGSAASTVIPAAPVAAFDGPVVDLPPRTLGRDDARGLYLVWQRSHGAPVPYSLSMSGWSPPLAAEPLVQAVAALDSGDRIAERPVDAAGFRQRAFAEAVAGLRRDGVDPAAVAGAAGRLRTEGVAEVVLHLDLLAEGDRAATLALVTGALGPPSSVDDRVARWRL